MLAVSGYRTSLTIAQRCLGAEPFTLGLGPEQQSYLHEKAEKLRKYFGRLMGIEIAVDHSKHGWQVEILVSAEHKHDFVASERNKDLLAAVDLVLAKLEGQVRKYKEKVQDHRRTPSTGDVGASRDEDEADEA